MVAQVDEGQFAVRGSTEIWSEFLTDMGFTIPPEIVGPDFSEISAENVEMFGALDVLVWLASPDQVGVSRDLPRAPRGPRRDATCTSTPSAR